MSKVMCMLCKTINDPGDIESGNCGCWFERPEELAKAEKEDRQETKRMQHAEWARFHEAEGGG